MRHVHLPVWLGTASAPRARTFATLFSLSAVGRTLLVTLIPLQALTLLGDAQAVSVLYFAISLTNLLLSLSIPWLVRRIRRRRVFTVGGLLMVAAPLVIALGTPLALVAGMALQVFGVACLEITLSLYLMDHIPRQEMGRFEPMRLFYAAGVWAVGPWLGVYLKDQVSDWVPFALASAAAFATLSLFWILRLQENPAVAPAKGPPPNPLKNLAHFFEQPVALFSGQRPEAPHLVTHFQPTFWRHIVPATRVVSQPPPPSGASEHLKASIHISPAPVVQWGGCNPWG